MSENVREPQVLDTIGKGGNYWRITEIDEKGSITAWKIYDGKIYKKGRPLRINVEKIKDGTFRLLDIPPVTIIKQEPINPEWGKEILPPEEEAEEGTDEIIQDDRTREDMQDEINSLRIALIKADKELDKMNAQIGTQLDTINGLRAAEKERDLEVAKMEGQIAGLMTALKALAEARA